MGLVYDLLQKIYNSNIPRRYRKVVKEKITDIVTPIVSKETQIIKSEILHLDNKVGHYEVQMKKFRESLQNFPPEWHKKVNDIVRYHKNNNPYQDNLLEKMENFCYHQASAQLGGLFSQFIDSIFKDEMTIEGQYHPFLFSEIMKMYLYPGGIWDLNKLLVSLTNPENIKKEESQDSKKPKTTAVDHHKPLKILYVCGMFPSLEHGGGGRIFDIISELAKEHEIDLYSVFDKDLDQFSLDLLEGSIKNVELIKLKDLSIDRILKWLEQIGKDLNEYDVIQLEYPHTIHLINDLKRYKPKTGFTFMECNTKSFSISIDNSIKAQKFAQISDFTMKFWNAVAAEKHALENVDFRIAVTPEDAEVLKTLSPVKIDVVPTCISQYAILDEYERLKDAQYEKNSVAFLGYFNHFPNIDSMRWYLQDIHPLIKAEIPDYRFYVIGRGNTATLQELVHNDKSVIFTGRVDSVVPNILRAQLCVSPLISGAGIRGKQNQYSVLGKPSVTTSIGNKGLKYVNGESVVIADTTQDFADGIIRLLTDEQFYNKLKNNAQKIAIENYTWKNQIANLVNIYRGSC